MPTHDSGQSRPQRRRTNEEVEAARRQSDVAERHEKLTEDVDAILDEIDEVLETNAEDFVARSCKRAASSRRTPAHGDGWVGSEDDRDRRERR